MVRPSMQPPSLRARSSDEVLALVPARGGSKSLPRKNLRPLAGHPLLAWSIAAAHAASSVGCVIVSTDDEEIREVALQYGAAVPFLRPSELGEDDTPDLPVFQHALKWLEAEEGYRPDLIVHLRPTSPLREPGMVDAAVSKLAADLVADALRTVSPATQSPFKMWREDAKHLTPLMAAAGEEPYNRPRQALPEVLWQTGHVDVVRRRTLFELDSMSGRHIASLRVASRYAVDIDSVLDWERAEAVALDPTADLVRPMSPIGLKDVQLVVFDFDGVFTDNRVYVAENGLESVACDRSDGHGVSMLHRLGLPMAVLSTEVNAVVAARCLKLGLFYRQGLGDEKAQALHTLVAEHGVSLKKVLYVGNDVNDLECLRAVGVPVVPADAHPDARRAARWVLRHPGGRGAVREVCDGLFQAQMPGS